MILRMIKAEWSDAHVSCFNMYKVHQMQLSSNGYYNREKKSKKQSCGAVSERYCIKKIGAIHISLSNIDTRNSQEVTIELPNISSKTIRGEILTSSNLTDHNTFENPNKVKITSFSGASKTKNGLIVKLPAKSIVTLEIK